MYVIHLSSHSWEMVVFASDSALSRLNHLCLFSKKTLMWILIIIFKNASMLLLKETNILQKYKRKKYLR